MVAMCSAGRQGRSAGNRRGQGALSERGIAENGLKAGLRTALSTGKVNGPPTRLLRLPSPCERRKWLVEGPFWPVTLVSHPTAVNGPRRHAWIRGYAPAVENPVDNVWKTSRVLWITVGPPEWPGMAPVWPRYGPRMAR